MVEILHNIKNRSVTNLTVLAALPSRMKTLAYRKTKDVQ